MSKKKNNKNWCKKLHQGIIEQVLDYYDNYRLCVIPIYPKSRTPVVKWKQYQNKRPDRETVITWFKEGIRNIGVIAGNVSNCLTCRDFDTRREYAKWKDSHPDLAKTLPTARTSRGYHVYFRSSATGCRAIRNGELRGSKCICVLPNSLHKSGVRYEWIIPFNGEIPEIHDYETVFDVFAEEPGKGKVEEATNNDTVENCADHEASSSGKSVEEPDEMKHKEEPTNDAAENRMDQDAPSSHVVVEETREKKTDEDSNTGASENSKDHNVPTTDLCSLPEVKEAIRATVPEGTHQRNRATFNLCRWLKAIPSLRNLAGGKLRPIVEEWHKQALDVIETKAFTETWADFLNGWDQVKYPKGEGGLEIAVKRAMKAEYCLPDEDRYDIQEVKLLIKIFYELQQIKREEPVWVSCRDAGGILGIDKNQAGRYMKMLAHDDPPVLETIEKNTTRKATRYRFIGEAPTKREQQTSEDKAA